MSALSEHQKLQKLTFEILKTKKAAKNLIAELLDIVDKAVIEGSAYHRPLDLKALSLGLQTEVSEEIKRRFNRDYDSPPLEKFLSDRIIVTLEYYTGWRFEYSVLEQLVFKICTSDLISSSPWAMSPPYHGVKSMTNLLDKLIGGHSFQSTFLLPEPDPIDISRLTKEDTTSSRHWARNILDRNRLLKPYFKNPILWRQLQEVSPVNPVLKQYLREELNAFAVMGPLTHNGLFYYDVLFENEEDEILMRVKFPSEYSF